MKTGTIGEFISRIRNLVKGVKQDAFLTDRFLYSIVRKHANWLLKREDGSNKLQRQTSIYQVLGCVELIEVDKVQANCIGLKTGCTIKRTAEKVPVLLEGYYGPIIRSVSSLDGSEELQEVLPSTYISMTKLKTFRYNKQKYYWYLDGHLYFPDLEWDAVRIEGLFEDDVTLINQGIDLRCAYKQDGAFNVPDYLHGELEAQVMKDLTIMLQIPTDTAHDKQAITQ